jgi:predicted metal-dependent enzyme (double-stranded beta helix superfamily)
MIALIRRLTELADQRASVATMLRDVPNVLRPVLAREEWLPAPHKEPHPDHYQQYLLYLDPQNRFSIVSFVWGPGQETPIHDHMTWGVVGQLRGHEVSTNYTRNENGTLKVAGVHTLKPGETIAFSPEQGDIHQVRNGSDAVSVSIHIYGGDIGRIERHKYDAATGTAHAFVSGYSQAAAPQWDANI